MCEPEGWIKIHRKILKWEWYDDTIVFKLFLHCLFKANFEEKQWHGISIPKGSFVTSISNLAGETFLTIKQVRNALNKLIKTNEITTKGTNKFTMLTVNNYDTYQVLNGAGGQTKGKQRANGGQTEGKQRATTKEVKNIRSKELEEEKNIPEVKTSGDTKPNYIKILYNVFTDEYKLSRGYEFDTDTIRKEESAIGKLAQGYKKRNPGKDTDDAIAFFSEYFKKCLKIEHEFLKRSMSPSLILNQKTQINTIIKEGNYATTKPATNSRNDRLTIQQLAESYERSKATIYADATKHCGNYRTGNAREQPE